MENLDLRIDDYEFHLKLNNDGIIISSSFSFLGKSGKEMTKEELLKGQFIQQAIFDGEYGTFISCFIKCSIESGNKLKSIISKE